MSTTPKTVKDTSWASDPLTLLKVNAVEVEAIQTHTAVTITWGQPPIQTFNQSKMPGIKTWRLATGEGLVEWKGYVAIIPAATVVTFMVGKTVNNT